MDFHEIWYLSISLKSVEKIQVSSRCDKNNGYFTLNPLYVYPYSSSSMPLQPLVGFRPAQLSLNILSRKVLQSAVASGTSNPQLGEDTFILIRTVNVSDKSCRENQDTQFMFNNFFFFENCAVYEIMWKNVVEPDRPQVIEYGSWALHVG
jgi:hypothetical protein